MKKKYIVRVSVLTNPKIHEVEFSTAEEAQKYVESLKAQAPYFQYIETYVDER